MGPNEREALNSAARTLRIKKRLHGLTVYEGRELDKIEADLQREEYNDRIAGRPEGTAQIKAPNA